MQRTILLTLSLFFLSIVSAQIKNDTTSSKTYNVNLKLDVENGITLSNGSAEGDDLVAASYYNGVDVRVGFRRRDKNHIYSTVYRRPTLGVGFYSSTFQNPDIGTPFATYFFLDIPFAFAEEKKFNLSYTAAFGLSYNFNPYDSINNPANVLIGSFRNCYVHLGFTGKYELNDNWSLDATLGFKHFSNGSFRKPNSGLNVLPISVGASYTFGKDDVHEYVTPLPRYIKHDLINVAMSVGGKNYQIGEPVYLKMELGVNYLRQINYRYRVGLGLDVFYSDGAEDRFASGANGFAETMSFALVGSWEWAITERLYAPIGIGVYLHRNSENDEWLPIYERVGLRYRFTEHICGGLTIKAHGGKADIFEWTMGYTFYKDPNFTFKKRIN